MLKKRTPEPVEYGTDNIFADLDFANPEEHLAKAKLAVQIVKKLEEIEQAEFEELATGLEEET